MGDDTKLEDRVGKLEIIIVQLEPTVKRHEHEIRELKEKQEKHLIEQTKTSMYIENINNSLATMKDSIKSIQDSIDGGNDKKEDRWAKIVERAFWAIVTIVGYFLGKGGGIGGP